jgi:hypothetical protein
VTPHVLDVRSLSVLEVGTQRPSVGLPAPELGEVPALEFPRECLPGSQGTLTLPIIKQGWKKIITLYSLLYKKDKIFSSKNIIRGRIGKTFQLINKFVFTVNIENSIYKKRTFVYNKKKNSSFGKVRYLRLENIPYWQHWERINTSKRT